MTNMCDDLVYIYRPQIHFDISFPIIIGQTPHHSIVYSIIFIKKRMRFYLI